MCEGIRHSCKQFVLRSCTLRIQALGISHSSSCFLPVALQHVTMAQAFVRAKRKETIFPKEAVFCCMPITVVHRNLIPTDSPSRTMTALICLPIRLGSKGLLAPIELVRSMALEFAGTWLEELLQDRPSASPCS